MHELSIALSIVERAEEAAARNGAVKVQKVHLRVGLLTGVARDALQFAFEMATEGTLLEGSRLVFEETEGRELDMVALEVE